MWFLSTAEVRNQLIVVAAGTCQLALPAGAVEGFEERGLIYPVPRATPLFLGVVASKGRLIPLLSIDKAASPWEKEPEGFDFALDLGLQCGPSLAILRLGEELLGIAFERFVGFHGPGEFTGPRPPAPAAKWVQASGTIDEIPVWVVDTGALFDYCKARLP